MRPLWRFIRNKNNREMIGWLGGGLVILVAGARAIFTYVYPPAGPPKPPARVEAHDGSIAIGGNVSNSTIGPTPEQIRDAMAAVIREESAARMRFTWSPVRSITGLISKTFCAPSTIIAPGFRRR